MTTSNRIIREPVKFCEDTSYGFEERSAIKEFEGGMDRAAAEDQAFDEALDDFADVPDEEELINTWNDGERKA